MTFQAMFSRAYRRLRWVMGGSVLLLTGLACTLTVGQPESTSTPPLSRPVPTSASVPLSDWEVIVPGIERRTMDLPSSGSALVLRFDPGSVTFRVHYSPTAPRSLDEWRAELAQAAVIVNGGFFDENDRALGLVVVDGQSYGQSFTGFGGMFQVGWDGVPRVRSLIGEPYQGESLLQTVQSFPMLVEAGGVQARQGDGFDQLSRRTVIAQDRAGRVVLIVIADGVISFAELQIWLLSSDLDLYIALALDGGRSTGLDIMVGSTHETISAASSVPVVIAVYVP